MLHNIPKDTGGSWRWKQLIKLCEYENDINDDPSPTMVLNLWAEYHKLNPSQRTWLSYLYGLTYSTTSAIAIFRTFPTLKVVNSDAISQFWDKFKNALYFNRDRRYIKNNDQFVPAIMCIKRIYGTSQGLHSVLNNLDDSEIYNTIVKKWDYFGRHSAFLFFDAYSKMVRNDRCTLSSIKNWNDASTIAEGLALAVYDDDLYTRCCHKKITSEDSKKLDILVSKIISDVGKPFTDIESAICAYTKLFKGTRYLGYYIDRFQEELNQCEILPKDIKLLYKLRKEVTPEEYLGESAGWSGIRKERNKLFLEEGRLL